MTTTCIIPAAGKGTRLWPLTQVIPKELLPLGGWPLLWHVITEAAIAGCQRIIIVTSEEKPQLRQFFSAADAMELQLRTAGKHDIADRVAAVMPQNITIDWCNQPSPRGFGDAIRCALPMVEERYCAIALPDMLCMPDSRQSGLSHLLIHHAALAASLIAVMPVAAEMVSAYGIVALAEHDDMAQTRRVQSIVEKPSVAAAPSCLAVAGRYVVPKALLTYLQRDVIGVGGEIQLTDALAALAADEAVFCMPLSVPLYDCGDFAGWRATEQALCAAELVHKRNVGR